MPNTSMGDTGNSSTDIAASKFAVHARKTIKLITSLRALGAEADFDLPRIAVIGNQSAGKSSLVEAISGIAVPRAAGRACTRCPMECRLTNSDRPWQCQILLRREVDGNGRQIYPVQEERFGPVLHDKAELEEMIRRAQLAILNPGVAKGSFEIFDTTSLKPGEKPEISQEQLEFSSNVVCLDLQGPDLPDLSFIDLPGIISMVGEDEDESNIEAIKNMVEEHIKGNTLILLTINMRDDMSNQGAARLAKLSDEKGDRTIGVLTKADLIQDGEEDGWLTILEGSSHSLRHGYFITKHPSPKELEGEISHAEARRREARFFETTYPWNKRSDLQSRMGTPNLTKELSNLLGTLINQELPKLRREAKESLDTVRERLSALPPPPSDNPASELLRMITSFCDKVQSLIRGAESHERLIQKCRPAYKTFKRDIRRTAPQFKPYDSSLPHARRNYESSIDSESELDEHESDAMPISLARQLPYNVPFSAKVALIEKVFESWEDHCDTCFTTVYEATTDELYDLVQRHFGTFEATPLLDHVHTIVEEEIEKAKSKTLERVRWMLDLEYPPFTSNDHYFSSYRDKYLAHYKAARKPNQTEQDPELVQEALGLLARLGYPASEDVLARLHGPDEYDQELIVMAETSAYFHVCYKRIIDNIPRVVDHDFLRSIERELQPSLIAGLSLGTDQATERAGIYLAEDQQVTAERFQLLQKRDRLESVLSELYRFQITSGPSEGFVPLLLPSHSVAAPRRSASKPSITRPARAVFAKDRARTSMLLPAGSSVSSTESTNRTTPPLPPATMNAAVARLPPIRSPNLASAQPVTPVVPSESPTVAPARDSSLIHPESILDRLKKEQKILRKKAKAARTATEVVPKSPSTAAARTTLRAGASEFTPTLVTDAPSARAFGQVPASPSFTPQFAHRASLPTLTEPTYGQSTEYGWD
ncbi:uncharacterized protein PHACADRAFT_207519 [Phanerochaete carnosa HHB-10118-sp]|uniref:Dynamin-type G domain-containing protein n=1 Tax=Phanerochaete carnosa (strain HHB-10118-sp) TaxID=650164 RepID=K5WAJ2_PHACS|nr:uncharacterized protein PHACADRAFT_207519 [Phanerochaete carnosa HHB-10118-sp]EKM56235.1 hypothetical protein PHACADRAFT_207519 [Phanerochaete carnosa HHB-10118-sp]